MFPTRGSILIAWFPYYHVVTLLSRGGATHLGVLTVESAGLSEVCGTFSAVSET